MCDVLPIKITEFFTESSLIGRMPQQLLLVPAVGLGGVQILPGFEHFDLGFSECRGVSMLLFDSSIPSLTLSCSRDRTQQTG